MYRVSSEWRADISYSRQNNTERGEERRREEIGGKAFKNQPETDDCCSLHGFNSGGKRSDVVVIKMTQRACLDTKVWTKKPVNNIQLFKWDKRNKIKLKLDRKTNWMPVSICLYQEFQTPSVWSCQTLKTWWSSLMFESWNQLNTWHHDVMMSLTPRHYLRRICLPVPWIHRKIKGR